MQWNRGRTVALGLLLSAMVLPTVAQAQAPTAPATAPRDKKENLAEAKAHYEAGLRLYDSGDYDAARVEFERAYSLAPIYRILYNLGLILKLKSDYVGAIKTFDLYLEEGGNEIPDARKKEVNDMLTELRGLVGSVTVTTNVPGADVSVDDVVVGKTPFAKPVLVNPGRRRIGAAKPGRIATAKAVDVASKENVSVALELGEQRQVIVVDRGTRVPWVGWIATGALAVTAGVTGYVALNASNTLSDERDKPNADGSRLDKLSSRTLTFGIIADVATVGALIAGGLSLYYTIKWNRDGKEKEPAPQARVLFGPTGVAGTF